MDFIYERFRLPNGVKIEEVSGGSAYKGKVWLQIARQIYCENGKNGFRDMGHYQSGAPFLYGADERISLSHTDGLLVVATLKAPSYANLSEFSPETALGIDVEKADREKVLRLRERFLTPEEMEIVPQNSLETNIIAWTCKEAMLKAGMNPTIDWHHNIIITSLPGFDSPGKGYIKVGENEIGLVLNTLRRDGYIISVASSV